MDDKKVIARDEINERDRIRYKAMLESFFKFKFFFAGLVFAILSFSIQFSVNSPLWIVKLSETIAWTFLIITGYFALRDCGGFRRLVTDEALVGLSPKQRYSMWSCFMIAIIFLLISRIMRF